VAFQPSRERSLRQCIFEETTLERWIKTDGHSPGVSHPRWSLPPELEARGGSSVLACHLARQD